MTLDEITKTDRELLAARCWWRCSCCSVILVLAEGSFAVFWPKVPCEMPLAYAIIADAVRRGEPEWDLAGRSPSEAAAEIATARAEAARDAAAAVKWVRIAAALQEGRRVIAHDAALDGAYDALVWVGAAWAAIGEAKGED